MRELFGSVKDVNETFVSMAEATLKHFKRPLPGDEDVWELALSCGAELPHFGNLYQWALWDELWGVLEQIFWVVIRQCLMI